MISSGLRTQIIEIIIGMILRAFDKYVCRKSPFDTNINLKVLQVADQIKGQLRRTTYFLFARICDI